MTRDPDDHRRVLVLAYDFPPAGGAGVQRTTKFVKYLPDAGWDPVVLTVRNPLYLLRDESLVEEVPDEVRVRRVAEWLPNRALLALRARLRRPGRGQAKDQAADHPGGGGEDAKPGGSSEGSRVRRAVRRLAMVLARVAIPDIHLAWTIPAALRARRIIRRDRCDAVYATAPPFSVLLTGWLATAGTATPLVIDYRDAWGLNPLRVGTRKAAREGPLERRILADSARAIFATDGVERDYARAYPQWQSKFHTITNGYDEADFRGVAPEPLDPVSVVYTGRITEKLRLDSFIAGLRALIERRPELERVVRVHVVGDVYPTQKRRVSDARLDPMFRFHPYVPHGRALSYMLGADILLLLGSGDLSEIPGKLFEYLRSGRPILAVAPRESEAGRLILRAERGIVTPPDSPREVEVALERLIDESRDRASPPVASSVVVDSLQRQEQARRLAAILEEITVPRSS